MAKLPVSLLTPQKEMLTTAGVKMSLRSRRLFSFLQSRGIKMTMGNGSKYVKKYYAELQAAHKELSRLNVETPMELLLDAIKDVEVMMSRKANE